MSKGSILFVFAILFFFALAFAALSDFSLLEAQKDAENVNVGVEAVSCEGLDEEECLLRRSLQAHTDYIYTQAHIDYIYTQASSPETVQH